MSRRVIGQEILNLERGSRSRAMLERLLSLIDWQPVAPLLAPLISTRC